MKLQEIFDALSAGEFSQLSIGGQGAGVISEENYSKVLTHVNAALTALYTRFNLKENRLKLELVPGKTKYELHSSFAVNVRRSLELVRYIKDTPDDPFQDDIIKISKVLTDAGLPLSLNDHGEEYSVMTPSSTVLRVPTLMVTAGIEVPPPLITKNLVLVYQAAHPVLSVGMGFFDPARINVELPRTHMEALLFYVASRANNPVGMVNEFNAGNNYFMKYEGACQMLEGKGIQVDQGSTYDRIQRNGWA